MEDDSEDTKAALNSCIDQLVEDTLQVYERLTEYFHDYGNSVLNSALVEVSTLLNGGNVDGFLEIYSDLEKRLPRVDSKDKFEEAARIRAAANLYVTAYHITGDYGLDEDPEILFLESDDYRDEDKN